MRNAEKKRTCVCQVAGAAADVAALKVPFSTNKLDFCILFACSKQRNPFKVMLSNGMFVNVLEECFCPCTRFQIKNGVNHMLEFKLFASVRLNLHRVHMLCFQLTSFAYDWLSVYHKLWIWTEVILFLTRVLGAFIYNTNFPGKLVFTLYCTRENISP